MTNKQKRYFGYALMVPMPATIVVVTCIFMYEIVNQAIASGNWCGLAILAGGVAFAAGVTVTSIYGPWKDK